MDHGRENDSTERREALIGELGRGFAEALLSGDEVGAESAIREAMEAGFSTAEITVRVLALT